MFDGDSLTFGRFDPQPKPMKCDNMTLNYECLLFSDLEGDSSRGVDEFVVGVEPLKFETFIHKENSVFAK